VFSFERLKGMSRYGISMLLTSLVESVYNELRGLLIGKLYSTADLAYHDKGRQIPTLVMTNVQNSVSTVFFSALTHENSREDMRQKVQDNLGMMMFIMGPILMGLASVSAPLITFLYTEKWVGAAPYLVMYCLSYLTWVIQTPVLQALNAIGKADTTLRLTTVHCFIGLALLFAMMSLGPVAVAASVTVANVIITVIIMMIYNKHFAYSFLDLVKDVGVTVVQLGAMVLAVSLVGNFVGHTLLKLIVQVLTGAAVYVLLSELLKNKAYIAVKNTAIKKIKKH
jgi:O-antigen/teichoic acid export membrane protein